MVLIVSFVALAVLWPSPRLQQEGWRPLPDWFSRVTTSQPLEIVCGAVGILLLGVVVWSGLRGVPNSLDNFAPTFVYITFWLGFVPASLLFGDVFRAFNPWRAIGRGAGWVAGQVTRDWLPEPLTYPPPLGRWPAVVGLVAFGWLELAAPNGNLPETVAAATLIYTALTFIAMGLYGVEPWVDRGETFSVYFNVFSRLSVFERRGKQIGLRRPLSGLPQLEQLPGTVPLLAAMIGIVSFDGFSAGRIWNGWVLDLQESVVDLGVPYGRSLEVIFGLGMLAMIALVYLFYRLGIAGMRTVDRHRSGGELSASFVHTLGPIALAYTAAHYVSFLLLQGQSIVPLASDPLGNGSDLFGTAAWTIDYGWIGGTTFWYIQVAVVVLGHAAALALAHDRALVTYPSSKLAARSQLWMLAVMIGFTTLALWLLSEGSKG